MSLSWQSKSAGNLLHKHISRKPVSTGGFLLKQKGLPLIVDPKPRYALELLMHFVKGKTILYLDYACNCSPDIWML